jgi:hypothetical protein
VPSDKTKISYSYDPASSTGELSIWCHITRIAEYFVGEGKLQSWLSGFDLTPIFIGNLKVWEYYQDMTENGRYYYLYFQAPANIIAQHSSNYTLTIDVSPFYLGEPCNMQQIIEINMSSDNEIKETSPSNITMTKSNTATFVMGKDDRYPTSFTVLSGPPTASLSEVIWQGASLWLFTPGGWAALATLSVLAFTGLRGRRILNRNRLYHRLYKGMVKIYDVYSTDLPRFAQEMDNISRSIIKFFVEDKITDDQFEKLLTRRDDLLNRMQETEPTVKP